MPFFVTMLKEYTAKVDTLMAERKEAREAVEQAQGAHKAAAAAVAAMMPLALPAAPGAGAPGVGGAPMPPPLRRRSPPVAARSSQPRRRSEREVLTHGEEISDQQGCSQAQVQGAWLHALPQVRSRPFRIPQVRTVPRVPS